MKKICLTVVFLLTITKFSYAQWTQVGTTGSYYLNSGNAIIGAASSTVINSSSPLFPGATPKTDIITGTDGTTAYSELMTIRHAGVNSSALNRQLGLLLKLSGESSTGESNKQGGIILESSQVYANYPSLSLIAGSYRALTALSSNGYVGISTTTPAAMLTVQQGSGVGFLLGADNGAQTLTANTLKAGSIGVPGYASGAIPTSVVWATSDVSANTLSIGGGLAAMNATTTTNFYAAANNNTNTGDIIASITHTGLGIGTTSPLSAFQLNSGVNSLSMGKAGGANLYYGTCYMGFNATRDNTNTWNIAGDGYHNGGGVIYTDVFGNIYLAPLVSAGTGNRTLADLDVKSAIAFRVNSTGTYTKQVYVQLTGWPDYVFKSSYNLPSLTDIKNYIDKNHHLPNMPTANDIEKNGLNLGEINKLLTKKVEELTLYMIEKDKQLDDEKSRNDKQQQQIDQLKALLLEQNKRLEKLESGLDKVK